MKPLLYIQKIWQTAGPVVVIQGNTRVAGRFEKKFLVLNGEQEHFDVYLTAEKPQDLNAQDPFPSLCRKYLQPGWLGAAYCNRGTGDIWLCFVAKDEPWFIEIRKSRPPEINLIDPNHDSLVRLSQKGSYTKRKTFEGPWPNLSAAPWFPLELLAAAQPEAKQAEESIAPGNKNLGDEPQKELARRLKRRLRTMRKALVKLEGQVPKSDELVESRRQADLLKTYAYRIKEGEFSLQLEPEITGLSENVEIPLDPEVSPGENVNRAFTRVKKLERGFEKGGEALRKARNEVAALEKELEKLQGSSLLPEQLDALSGKYKLAEKKRPVSVTQEPVAKPFRTFRSSLGPLILVGKGPHENDELTKKAKANDYWLHVVGIPGSHVVVPAKGDLRTALPEAIKREAAILACHFSKLRQDFAGEVYITRRQNLKKTKGMAPGLWLVERSESLFVRFDEAELTAILDRWVP